MADLFLGTDTFRFNTSQSLASAVDFSTTFNTDFMLSAVYTQANDLTSKVRILFDSKDGSTYDTLLSTLTLAKEADSGVNTTYAAFLPGSGVFFQKGDEVRIRIKADAGITMQITIIVVQP